MKKKVSQNGKLTKNKRIHKKPDATAAAAKSRSEIRNRLSKNELWNRKREEYTDGGATACSTVCND